MREAIALLALAATVARAQVPDSVPPRCDGKTITAIDVQALLNANACLGCHAIDKKVVGPAYRDVAAKYKGDAQALAKLEASIRQGGVGKWGQVPMPPSASLSGAQAKALAEFVLKQ